MATDVVVKMDRKAIQHYLRDQNKPVMRRTFIVADRVKQGAIAEIRSDFPKQFIGRQIVKRYGTDSRSAYVDVGVVKTRTRPHVITGNPLLVFFWPKAGRVVAFPRVNHPGSNFGPYVRRILLAALNKVRGHI